MVNVIVLGHGRCGGFTLRSNIPYESNKALGSIFLRFHTLRVNQAFQRTTPLAFHLIAASYTLNNPGGFHINADTYENKDTLRQKNLH
jgi:hypothetical protein